MKKISFAEYRKLKTKKENRKRKVKEFLQLFLGFLAVAGFFIIVGTAGKSDLNMITYGQVKIRLTIGLAVLVIPALIAKKLGNK